VLKSFLTDLRLEVDTNGKHEMASPSESRELGLKSIDGCYIPRKKGGWCLFKQSPSFAIHRQPSVCYWQRGGLPDASHNNPEVQKVLRSFVAME